ncbi:hypothetical protein L2090_21210 [Rahnella victoriana]|nr:hypothetical protein [Rahnella victoriana]
MKKLSAAQSNFMAALQAGKSASRDISNSTGKSLQCSGLVKFVVMVGWVLTPEGCKCDLEANP